MSKRQLPQQPSLVQLKKQAKDLLKAYRSSDSDAVSRVRDSVPRLKGLPDEAVVQAACTLQDMQYVVAFELGFADWAHLRREVEAMNGDSLGLVQEAVRTGDIETVKRLLAADPGLINRRSAPNEATLLHLASITSHAEVARILIEAGADLEATSGEGWRPLHSAAAQAHLFETMEVLLAAGADVNAEACGAGGTPLAHALFHGLSKVGDRLAEHGVEPSILRIAAGLGLVDRIHELVSDDGTLSAEAGKGREFYRHHEEHPEWTVTDDPQEILDEALVYAADNGRLETVDVLIQKGANVSGVPYAASALHKAVMQADRAMVDRLLSHGADPTVRDRAHGGRAYDWTHYCPDPSLLQPLLEAGSKTDLWAAVKLGLMDRADALSKEAGAGKLIGAYKTAVGNGHDEIATLLLERGAKPSLFDYLELPQGDGVSRALAEGADPNATRDWEINWIGKGSIPVQQTAMQAAGMYRAPDLGAILADHGAEIDFHAAAFLDRNQEVRELAGEEVDRLDTFGMTALHRAIQGGAVDAVKTLLELGASVETPADTFTFGGRAIHVAAECGSSAEMIDVLIEAGADVNQNMNPGTPLKVAERWKHAATAEVLRGRGAVE